MFFFSMNETSKINSNKTATIPMKCHELDVLNGIYLRETISGIGFILNLICLFVFFTILRNTKNTNDLYKYILIESFLNAYVCLRNNLKNFLDCKFCIIEKHYSLKLCQIIFIYYIDYSFELISIIISVAACLNRYKSIDNSLKTFDKIPLVAVICFISVFCFGFCSYKLVDLNVQRELLNNSTDTVVYVIKSNALGSTGSTLDMIFTIMRDAIPIFSILLLNILTLVKFKFYYTKKRLVLNKAKRIKNNELRLNLMVFVTSSFVLINHAANFIYWLNIFGPNECFNVVRNILYWSSYGVGFFIYLSFDLNFKRTFTVKFTRK